MRKSAILTISLGLSLTVSPATGQVRDPEVRRYRFVSEVGHANALWVNPAWLGFNQHISLVGLATWDRPEDTSWTTGQYLVGLQSGVLGFGYRHDEFDFQDGLSQGDAYTVAVGLARSRSGLGVSRTWHKVGSNDGSWEIGLALRPSSTVAAGVVWRDIGSPEVRDTVRDERLIGGLTVRPPGSSVSLSLEADYRTDRSDFRAFRIGGNFGVMGVVEAIARAEWDGDGDFDRLLLGAEVRFGAKTALGLVGMDSGGDARVASAGLAASFQKPR